MRSREVWLRRFSGLQTTYILLFIGSTGLMGLSKNVVLVTLWVLMWLFARMSATKTRGSEVLIFWMAFLFFYPVPAAVYSSLHEQPVMKTLVLGAFAITHLGSLRETLSRDHWLRFIWLAWVGWGSIAYLPVFLAWLSETVLGLQVKEILDFIVYSLSTNSKTGLPIITSVMAALLPLIALREPQDFRRLTKATLIAVAVVLTVSFVEFAFSFRFFSSDYPVDPTRMGGFCDPDPNGFGRLLLLPTLLFLSLLMDGSRRLLSPELLVTLLLVTAIALTQSRTTYISFAVGFVALLLLHLRNVRLIPVTFVILIATVVAAQTFGLMEAFAPGSERVSMAHLESRYSIYENVVEIIRANPWFGAFPGGYLTALAGTDYHGEIASAHNMLLSIAVEWGIPMALILVVAIGCAVVYGLRTLLEARRLRNVPTMLDVVSISKAAAAAALAYFVHGLTEIVPPDFVFLVFGLALASLKVMRASAASGASERRRVSYVGGRERAARVSFA